MPTAYRCCSKAFRARTKAGSWGIPVLVSRSFDAADLQVKVAIVGLDIDLPQITLQGDDLQFTLIYWPIRSPESGDGDSRRG